MPTRDLSHPLDSATTVYPGDPAVELSPAATHAADGYRVTEVRFGSHSGTHLDAPSHTEPGGRTIDAFDVSEFAFDARLVDCTEVGAREAVELADLADEIREEGDPTSGTENEMLVFRTGWDAHWGTDRYFDHPYLSRRVAAWCANRGYDVGLDALSPDPSPSDENEAVDATAEEDSTGGVDASAEPDGVPAHRELLGSERFVLENLTGLGDLPARFELRAYPLSLADGDGSPVRAVAVW